MTALPWLTRCRQELERLESLHRLRIPREVEPADGMTVRIAGKTLHDFCSNDYLGFARRPDLVAVAAETLSTHGLGTGRARLVGGSTSLHQALEVSLAQFHGAAKALLFNSGYQANLAILSALCQVGDIIFFDKLNHASLLDGAQLSAAKLKRYPHNRMDVLAHQLETIPCTGQRFIVTDSIFSMDGDCAPIAELDALARRYGACLILDEAHAVGLYGPGRAGLWQAHAPDVPDHVLVIGTCSKALGSFGAYIAGPAPVIDLLVQRSRGWIYTTALPAAVVAFTLAAVEALHADDARTRALWDNIAHMRTILGEATAAPGPIFPLVVGSDQAAIEAMAYFEQHAIYLQAIRPPSVPEGSARLRLTVGASHTPSQISVFETAYLSFSRHNRLTPLQFSNDLG